MNRIGWVLVLLLVVLSTSATAITFEIQHEDELDQIQQMQQQGNAKAAAQLQTTLEILQAEVEALRLQLEYGFNPGSPFMSGMYRMYSGRYDRYSRYDSSRYRSCVQDLIDDQYDLLHDASEPGTEISEEDLEDFRDQERRCRNYDGRDSFFDAYSPFDSFRVASCKYYDPYFSDWDRYLDWRRSCERRFPGFYDSYFGYSGYVDDYVYDADYHYGDNVHHYYYDDVLGRTFPGMLQFASYGDDFVRGAYFSYNSPDFSLDMDVPGVTRPDRREEYSSAAYTEWKDYCVETASVDGELSSWCVKTSPYWAD